MVIHTVADGERIKDIAQKYGVDEGILRKNNGIESGEAAIGEELLVLMPTRTYRMGASDTPERIALRFGVRSSDLYAYNPGLYGRERVEGELIALKYGSKSYGNAATNGYFYGGCTIDRLERMMPYLTYVTVASTVMDEGGIGQLFDHGGALECIARHGRIPLLRIYSRCRPESFAKKESREILIERIITAAKDAGVLGVTLGGCYVGGEFLVELRGRMIGCDLILITEMNEETPYESCEYADGSVLSYAKYAMEDIPDFKDGEEKVYSDFAVGAESSKTFVDIPSLAAVGDGYDTLNSALVSARRAGAEIIRDESTLICEFRHKSKGRCRYTSLKNIKAILDILNEYGFMGISFDIMRTPENLLMMYSALFRSTTPPVREGATGCGG